MSYCYCAWCGSEVGLRLDKGKGAGRCSTCRADLVAEPGRIIAHKRGQEQPAVLETPPPVEPGNYAVVQSRGERKEQVVLSGVSEDSARKLARYYNERRPVGAPAFAWRKS